MYLVGFTRFRKIDISLERFACCIPHGIYIPPPSHSYLVPFLVTIVLVRFIANM